MLVYWSVKVKYSVTITTLGFAKVVSPLGKYHMDHQKKNFQSPTSMSNLEDVSPPHVGINGKFVADAGCAGLLLVMVSWRPFFKVP